MGFIVSTEAIFSGIKTGPKKSSSTGELWLSLQFKAPEYYNGAIIPAETFTKPNLIIFPEGEFDHTSLAANQKYRLDLHVSARKNDKGFAQVDAKILKVHHKP